MPQVLLHLPDVRTVLHHVRGRRMPEAVRGELRRTCHGGRRVPDDSSHLPHIDAAAAHSEEERRTGPLRHERRSSPALPRIDRVLRGHPERHAPHLAALAQHRHEPCLTVHVVDVETRELRNPQARGVEQFEHRGVPERFRRLLHLRRDGRMVRGRHRITHAVEHLFRMLLLQHGGQTGRLLGRAQSGGGVLADAAGAEALSEEPAHSSRPPCDRRRGGPVLGHREHPVAQVARFDGVEREPRPVRAFEVGKQAADVAHVGASRVVGGAALDPQVRVELLHRVDVRGVVQVPGDEVARGGSTHEPRVAPVTRLAPEAPPSPSLDPSSVRGRPVPAFPERTSQHRC